MSACRIVVLTPWLVHRFRHGGQLRAASIIAAYRARGHEVRCIGLYDPAHTPADEPGPDDLAVTADIGQYIAREDATTELGFWRALARAPATVGFGHSIVRDARPQVIQFEEPYLWPLARKLGEAAALVHSSYNIESFAKRELQSSGLSITERTLADIFDLEGEIARKAHAVAVVSRQDADSFRARGARRVVVAPNGASAHPPDDEADRALASWLGCEPFALFVSSAHPPNAQGLVDMLRALPAGALGHGRLLVAGGVADILRDRKEAANAGGLFARVTLLGQLDDALLGAVHRAAHCIMLPKTRGGGSNLKTAEALLSHRPIVATRRAFEGFESHETDDGVVIEDDPARFWRAVSDRLAGALTLHRSPKSVADLTWNRCLAPMVELVETLAGAATAT